MSSLEAAARTIAAAAKRLGVDGLRPASEGRAVAHHGDREVVLQLKTMRTFRREDLEGRLAHAFVLSQREPGPIHVVVVALPRVTDAAVACATRFIDKYAPQLQWMLIGDNGEEAIQAPALGISKALTRHRRRAAKVASSSKGSLFTDLGAWMLKVLLLQQAPASLWPGPRGPVGSAGELAQRAGVSTPHAHRFVKQLESEGHLHRTGDGFRIVRVRALVEAWFEAQRLAPRHQAPMRWMMGKPSELHEIFAAAPRAEHASEGIVAGPTFVGAGIFGATSEPAIALAAFDACAAMGLLHATSFEHEVYVDAPIDDVADRFDLEPCDPRDAHLVLRSSRSASVWRGRIHRAPQLPHVDALQAALDVVTHPARGLEQAEFIAFDVLQLGAR